MSLDISSFTGPVKQPLHMYMQGKAKGLRKENYPKWVANQPCTRILMLMKGNQDSIETEVLDQISFSADHKVDYEDQSRKLMKWSSALWTRESGEVVRQIPGEDFVKLTQRIAEFNQKVSR